MNASLTKIIVDRLKATANVTAISGMRIYPTSAPVRVQTPYMVVSELSSTTEESHDDAMGLDTTQIEFACYAQDTLTALNLRQAVRATLLAPGAFPAGITVGQPTSRTFTADEQSLAQAILELTFMHNPSATNL